MTSFFTAIVCLTLAAVGAGAPARAAAEAARAPGLDAPLLVVVETGPGAGCDADAVRGAIAAELHTAVVAPSSSPVVALAGPRAHTLLVSIDRERIVVTLPGRAGEDLTRSVAAPADRAARLRVVAWLAGNVARDQLSTLTLAEAPPPPAAETATAPLVTAPAVSSPSPRLRATEPELTASARPEAAAQPPEFPDWTLSLSGGTAAMFGTSSTPSWNLGGQFEGHRHLGRWFGGLAIDVGPRDVHPFGGALVFGAQESVGSIRLEASAGVGVEEFLVQLFSPGGVLSEKQAAGYGRVALAASYPLVADLDILAQLTGHLTATTRSNPAFVAATLGLRVRLP